MSHPVSSSRSFRLHYVLPTLLLLAAAVLPLVGGWRTLYLRDVANAHLEMKWVQAEAMAEGRIPRIDPYRAGGQPHLGNPNTVPLYPDNLLYLVAPLFWAFNAHFWIHLLLAPFAFYALARAWGLGREASWAAGAIWATSGYYLSNLNLYNLVGGVTLAPALVAAGLVLARRPTAGRFAATAALWALVLLAGDPMTAALTGLLTASAVLVRHGWRPLVGWPLVLAIAGGTLLAAPQLVEFQRILALSFRGHWGYSATAAMAASWNPATVADWLIPFAFGRPDLGFWGHSFFQGSLPLYFSLYPGLLALALAAASGRPRGRAALWSWALVAGGLFFALGSFNPLVRWLAGALPANPLRLPTKLWLAVAIGAALLCGLGFERLLEGRRTLGRRLLPAAAVGFLVAAVAVWLAARPLGGWLSGVISLPDPNRLAGPILGRWIVWCGLSALLAVVLARVARLGSRRPRVTGAVLLGLHVAVQLLALRPLLASDEAAFYRARPPLADRLKAGSRVVHGAHDGLFGPAQIPVGSYPDTRLLWRQRQMHRELFPGTGMRLGLRYDFNISPEGLDAFLTRVTAQTFERLDDRARVRLLAASGVDYLLLPRDLASDARDGVEELYRQPSVQGELVVYRVLGRADPVQFVGRVVGSNSLNQGLERLLDPAFDPRTMAVLAGTLAPLEGPGGRAEVVSESAEELVVRVAAESAGALVVQRAFQPLYRATVDGRPAPLVAANLHRLGLELPAGDHQVRIRLDPAPVRRGLWLALAGLLALAAGAALLHRRAGPAPGRP